MRKFTLVALLLLSGVGAFSQSLEFVNKNGEIIADNSQITVVDLDASGMDAHVYVKNTGSTPQEGSLMLTVNYVEGGMASYCGFGANMCQIVDRSLERTTTIEPGETIDPEIHFMVTEDKASGQVEYKLTAASVEKKVTVIYSYDASSINSVSTNSNVVNVRQKGNVAELVYNFDSEANRQLNIYNVTGKLVTSDRISDSNGKHALALEKGLYIYSVSENGKVVVTHKFIVR